MNSSAIFYLVIACGQMRFINPSGVDLDAAIQGQVFEGVFEFLDDDGDGHVNLRELMALSVIGDGDGDGIVTREEFDAAWSSVAVELGLPMENRNSYFDVSDGADGTAKDGVLSGSENEALFHTVDTDGNGKLDLTEFRESVRQQLG